MKKKILHIIQSLDSGGCENFLLRVLPRLVKFDQKVLTLKCRGELAQEFEKCGVSVDNLNGKWMSLVREVRKFEPDIVVTYLFHADLLGKGLGLFTKYKPIPYLRTTYNFSRYKWIQLFEKFISFMVPGYLANSNSVKDFYVNKLGVEARKIVVIPNGIDAKDFNLPKDVRKDFRKKMGVKRNDLVITCVANFHPNKGHKYLLEAFEALSKGRRNVWLWLVGDGEEAFRLKEIVRSVTLRNRVVFFGKRIDVPVILGASDIFALPTLFEGMSNAILEAMASGLPVVTTSISENRELISNGKDGLLYDFKKRGELKEVLEKVVDSAFLRKSLGLKAREKVKRRYDIRVIAKRLNNFYENVEKS